jgi:hypothetical protein
MTLTDRVVATYREGLKVVWEPQWREARDVLARAAAANPDHAGLNGALRYTEGHLSRIAGDARKAKGDTEAARREYADAVTAFREAAQLRSSWPDPFIGLSRTFIAGLGDVDRGADALAQARRLGYTPGRARDGAACGGYIERGDSLWQSARDLRGMPQERDYLDACVGGVSAGARPLYRRRRVQRRAGERAPHAGRPRAREGPARRARGLAFNVDLGPLGNVTFQRNADEAGGRRTRRHRATRPSEPRSDPWQ